MGLWDSGLVGINSTMFSIQFVFFISCFFLQIQMVVYLWALFNIWRFHLTPKGFWTVIQCLHHLISMHSCLQPRSSIWWFSNSKLSLFVCNSAPTFSCSPTWEKNISRSNPPSTNNCRNPKQTFVFSSQKAALEEITYAYMDLSH